MNSDELADATYAVKATEALLRDARSALRRVEKLTDAALAADDADAHQLAEAAQRTIEQLVDHLLLANSNATAGSNEHCAGSADQTLWDQTQRMTRLPTSWQARRSWRVSGWAAWDGTDEEFQAAYDESRAAVRIFTSAVGEIIGKPPRRRGRGTP